MANDKKFISKNGLQTSNISFKSGDLTHTIEMVMSNSDVITFTGNAGTLMTISDNTSGTLFSVNDVSGVPSIEVIDTGTVRIAQTAGNVGIGIGSPATTVNIYNSSNAILRVDGDATSSLQVRRFSTDTSGPVNNLVKFRGTLASPTAVATGDIAGTYGWNVYGGTNQRSLGTITGYVETFVSDSNISGGITFATSNAGTIGERARIVANGNIGIGNTTPAHKLRVDGDISLSGGVHANGSLGSNGQVLISNGTISYWGTVSGASGLQTMWVPAISMYSRTTNGAEAGIVESTTNKVMTRTYDFDGSTQEFVQFVVRMPKQWNEGTIQFQPYWTAATANSGNVEFSMAGLSLSNNDAIDTAFGTSQASRLNFTSNNTIHVGPVSPNVTIAGTPAAGDLVVFQVARDVADDTLIADADLIGVAIFLTTDAGTDD